MLHIQRWCSGYGYEVKKYHCIFSFSPSVGDQPNNTEAYAVQMSETWLKLLEDKTSLN